MKFLVPASYEYHGHIEVEADDATEAIDKANAMTNGDVLAAIKANGPTIDVYVHDDPEDIEVDDDDIVEEGND